jgi:LacI family transcriptional regulator
VSLGDLAKAAGISRVAASYAMRNQPGVSEKTRQRVLKIAKQLGYVPDARIASWMARTREAKDKYLLPIVWLNTNPEKDAWQKYSFLSPYLRGAREECLKFGYRLEEIWANEPGMSMQRIVRGLYERRVEGVIITPPARHVRVNLDHAACVVLEGSLLAPGFHRVMSDLQHNFLLALRTLKRYGYRRIGVCFSERLVSYLHQGMLFIIDHTHVMRPRTEAVRPLFLPDELTGKGKGLSVKKWLRQQRPDVVICYDSRVVGWVEMAGYRVPLDIGVVHLAIDDDVLSWSGIHSHRRATGQAAAKLAISLVQSQQFGVPPMAFHTMVRGAWKEGRTLLAPAVPLNLK